MADKRRAGGGGSAGSQGPSGASAPSGSTAGKARARGEEPGLTARLVAQQFWTLMLIAGVVAIVSGWVLYDKLDGNYEVPFTLYAIFGVGVGIAAMTGILRIAFHAQIEEVLRREGTEKDARHLIKEVRETIRDQPMRLSPVQQAELSRAAEAVETALGNDDWDETAQAVSVLDQRLDDYLEGNRKSTAREYVESILVAVGIAFFLRAFVVEAFKIPSGSMIPTLQVGDHIFVNKFIYGIRVPWTNIKLGMSIRKPQKGEVVVFKFPSDQEKDFIKRIVAVEGDTVEIKNNVLFINGAATPREHLSTVLCEYEDFEEGPALEHRQCDAWKETLNGHTYTTIYDPGGHPRSWPLIKVPPGAVFVMGDNRDNLHDSRFWGDKPFVPFKLLRGKAMIIWFSKGEPEGIRLKRMFQLIY